MLGKTKGWSGSVVLLGGLLSATGACSGGDVSAGEEGDYVNLGRCYGANCDAQAQTTQGAEGEHPHCGGVQGTLSGGTQLELFFSIEAWDTTISDIKFAPDGSMWVLAMRRAPLGMEHAAPYLARYAPDGELVGITGSIEESDRAELQVSFGVDADGNATVSVFEAWAPNADAELTQHLNLYTYGPDLELKGSIMAFRGAADVRLAGDASGDLWLAGNVDNFDAHGILARLSSQEPQWIQTAVPSSGRRAGVGVAELAVTAEGQASVLAKINPRWNGGPDVDTFALSSFTPAGDVDWAVELPTDFAGGERPTLSALPSGDLIVGGILASEQTDGFRPALVRRVSKSGKLGWGYVVDSLGWSPNVATTSDGRTTMVTVDGVAVVSADGQECHVVGYDESEAVIVGSQLAVVGDYVLFVNEGGITRFDVPQE